MKAKLLENGWTEGYCDFKKTTCHDNPLITRPSVAITGTLSCQFSHMVQGNALFSVVPLGSAEGRRKGTDVRADWSTLLFGGRWRLPRFP